MRVRAAVGGFDCSAVVLVESASVKQDSTEAISTAEVVVFQKYGTARYDSAEYDRAAYNEFAVNEWDELVLWDQDTTQLLFAGFILSVQRAIEGPHLRLTLAAADWGILFERSLITQSWPDGTPDSTIITDALAQVPELSAGTIVTLVNNLGLIEAKDQRIRDLLDDICTLTGGEWSVSYNGKLNYYAAGSIVAPFGLSDHPNGTTLQPYVLEDYARDFADAANRVVVLGAVGETGELRATANDAASQAQFGVLSVSLVDRNLSDATTAALWAEAEVATRANPKVTIQATVYAAGLARGMTVPVEATRYGISSTLILRSLEIGIIAPDRERPTAAGHRLRYRATLGSRPPDLVYSLRRMQRRPVQPTQAPATSIAPGTIGPDDFLDSIEPVNVVSRKPLGAEWSQYSATAIFFLTTDRKLYRRTAGDDWTAVVPSSDITGQLQTTQLAPGSVTTTVLADGSVVTAKIPSGAITAPTIAVGAVTVSAIADGAVTTAKIPAGAIQAPQIAASAVTANAIAANAIAADKIQAGAVTANAIAANAVTAGAIAAGAITAGAISAGAVTATALAAGSVTANAIAANAVYTEALQANAVTTIKLAANSVVAGKIAALAVTAGTIAADAVTAGTIAAGAVVAGKIGAQAVIAGNIAAGAITADTIAAGSITSDKLSAVELAIGYGGSKPGRVGVYGTSLTLVALVGDLGGAGLPGNTYFGVWAKLCAFGGTGYSDAPMYTDAAGNLSLRQVALKITATDGSFIQTGPSVFDATYGSIMLNVVKSGDSAASLVSRGLVVRTSGGVAVAGALVRSPTNGLTSELVINNPAGALTIWGDGNTGVMRAAGFAVPGLPGRTQTHFGIDGQQIVFTGGICTNITGATLTGFWTTQTLLKSGGGSVTLTFNNGLLVNAV